MFVDHNSLAEKEVVLDDVVVSLVKKNQMYLSILEKLCSQSKPRLRPELRLDESGKPFLWVY
ncbi:MAG: hypothetical protein R3C03_04950 [Pirellulaceae bacterium]